MFLDSYEKQIILYTCTNKKINFIFITFNIIFMSWLYAVCNEYFELIVKQYFMFITKPTANSELDVTQYTIYQHRLLNYYTQTTVIRLSFLRPKLLNCYTRTTVIKQSFHQNRLLNYNIIRQSFYLPRLLFSGKVSTKTDCWTLTLDLLLSGKVSTDPDCWTLTLPGKVSTKTDCWTVTFELLS